MSHETTPPPYDSTVEQLYHAANDVEMQDAFPTTQQHLHVVIDTNVLIDYCGIVEQFCADVEGAGYPVLVVIPSVVLSELDGLKNRPELQWFARQATTWLLKKVKERRTVKLQASKETQGPAGGAARAEGDDVRKNDLAIRDCCLFFADRHRGFGALLVTMDKILSLECQREGLHTCLPPRRSWSSRLLAQALPVDGVDLSKFHEREAYPRYRPSRTRQRLAQTEAPAAAAGPVARSTRDEDMMDIDDGDAAAAEEYLPAHARDSLHAQIGAHFTLVLKDLCYRVHIAAGDSMAVAHSKHAPDYRQRPVPEWTAPLCLAYLQTKRPFEEPENMGNFLLLRGERGWRKGQDWPRPKWVSVLDALEEVGRRFGDGALLSSVEAVRPHVKEVWDAKLRPL
ncbi:PIN domain-containing protein [Lenzites betulinus]|nr:PIN domain-containing protein [Lenzites betulinus]